MTYNPWSLSRGNPEFSTLRLKKSNACDGLLSGITKIRIENYKAAFKSSTKKKNDRYLPSYKIKYKLKIDLFLTYADFFFLSSQMEKITKSTVKTKEILQKLRKVCCHKHW